MKTKILLGLFTLLFPLCSYAQGEEFVVVKGDCLPGLSDNILPSHPTRRALRTPNTDWDASRTYKQMVILFSFSDVDFTMENSKEYYQRLFNEEGYNERNGKGCVADYFREQSGGLLNMQFDIYGPVQVSGKAQPYDKPTSSTRNYGTSSMREATQVILDENPTVDYSQYDWDGDGNIEQVIYVYAGTPGNLGSSTYGCIWPNTSSFSTITTPDGKKISGYTASGEIWGMTSQEPKQPVYCGIGTICHEFSHSLGLPDIYPTSGNIFSAVDEWDLMDGGNFTNYGWCPPNYSPLEKMLLGWLTPIELTETVSITGMKPVSEGGAVYQIKHTDTEYLLLENRQWTGWDAGVPGKGLVIYHVNYNSTAWRSNRVNSFTSEDDFRYKLVHADNMNYAEWDDYENQHGISKYANSGWMNNVHLSTSAYPFDANDELTDTSIPDSEMQTGDANDETLLLKPISHIRMADDGQVSFDFHVIDANTFVYKRLIEGQESKAGGKASNSIPVDGNVILTIKPNRGFYVESENICVTRSNTTEMSRLSQRSQEVVEILETDPSADPSGITTYTYPYSANFTYQMSVDFQRCTDFSNEENKPVILLNTTEYEYDGSGKTPEVLSVTYGSEGTLVDPQDYEVSYQANVNAGTAEAWITGKRYFIGEGKTTFTILAKDITDKVTIVPIDNQVHTGEEIKPKLIVKDGDIVLESRKDYDATYSNNVEVGTATVDIAFKGNYTGHAVTTFAITESTGISTPYLLKDEDGVSCLYNLQGQRVYIPLPGRVYVVKKKDGTTYKYIPSYAR
ncbi:MAG: M6 family metalloprotease domain-containing protein [Prevotella sp.]|nr:M6 family metalloprotease domain-containing protein [Prevotella sp.]